MCGDICAVSEKLRKFDFLLADGNGIFAVKIDVRRGLCQFGRFGQEDKSTVAEKYFVIMIEGYLIYALIIHIGSVSRFQIGQDVLTVFVRNPGMDA